MDQLAPIRSHLAARGGATSRHLLLAEGITDQAIRRARQHEVLEQIRRGAYVAPAAGRRAEELVARRSVAVARSVSTRLALSHESALAAWGLPLVGAAGLDVHAVRLSSPSLNQRGLLRFHTCPTSEPVPLLAPFDDVLAVPPEIAIAQLAGSRGLMVAVAAADAAMQRGLTTMVRLEQAPGLLGTRSGIANARRVAGLTDPAAESPGESLTRLMMLQLRLGPIESQVSIRDERGFVGRVDFRVRRRGIVEFDGRIKYAGATGEVLWAEKKREDRLRRQCAAFARVVWHDLSSMARFREVMRASGILDLPPLL